LRGLNHDQQKNGKGFSTKVTCWCEEWSVVQMEIDFYNLEFCHCEGYSLSTEGAGGVQVVLYIQVHNVMKIGVFQLQYSVVLIQMCSAYFLKVHKVLINYLELALSP